MSETERSISKRNYGQSLGCRNLGSILGGVPKQRPRIEHHHRCMFCGNVVNGSAVDEGRIVEVTKGAAIDPDHIAEEDELGAVCTQCGQDQSVMIPGIADELGSREISRILRL